MSEASPDNSPVLGGEIFPDRYALTNIVKYDGSTVAAFGRDSLTGFGVFLKATNPRTDPMPDTIARMQQEVEALESLTHPQIPYLVDADLTADMPYVVSARMPGNKYVANWFEKAHMPHLAAKILVSALSPIQYVHEQGLVHADIKTTNLVLGWDMSASLVDFELSEEVKDNTPKPKREQVLVTVDYTSPEQLLGEVPTVRSDIYSAGVVLYKLLCGRLPYVGKFISSVMIQQAYEEVDFDFDPNESASKRVLPDQLKQIIAKAMRKDPDQRYESADEMREDLERYIRTT